MAAMKSNARERSALLRRALSVFGIALLTLGLTGLGCDESDDLDWVNPPTSAAIRLTPNAAAPFQVSEGGGTNSYTVRLATAPRAGTSVTVRVAPDADQLALGASQVDSFVFTSSNFEVAQDVVFSAIDDDRAEGTHQAIIVHSTVSTDPTFDGLVDSTAVVTITDNDNPAILVNISPTPPITINEGSTATYRIRLATEPASDVTVSLDFSGAFDPPNRVTPNQTSFTFTPAGANRWDVERTIVLTANNDDLINTNNGPFTLTHLASSADPDYDGLSAAFDLSVADDDTPGITRPTMDLASIPEGSSRSYELSINTEPSEDVIVTVTTPADSRLEVRQGTSGPYATTANIVFPQGTAAGTSRTVEVLAFDDDKDNPDGPFDLTHTISSAQLAYDQLDDFILTVPSVQLDEEAGFEFSNIPANLTFTNVSEGQTRTYGIELTSEPSSDVQVSVSWDPNDVRITSPGTEPLVLTFTPGNWDAAQEVVFQTTNDDVDQDQEVAIIFTHVVTGDSDYEALSPADNVTISLIDDEGADVILTPSSFDVAEGSSDTYSVALASSPSSDVVVEITGFAEDDRVDVNPSAIPFNGTNFDGVDVTVTIADNDVKNPQSVLLLLHSITSSSDSSYTADGTLDKTATVTILNDDDDPGIRVVRQSNATVVTGWDDLTEGDTDVYEVTLTSEPRANVSIAVAESGDDFDLLTLTPSESNLEFTPGNWNTPQDVTLAYAQDDISQPDDVVQVTLTASSSDGDYDGRGFPTAPDLDLNDDDQGDVGVDVAESISAIAEGAGASYTISLGTEPRSDVVISITPMPSDSRIETSVGGSPVSSVTLNVGNYQAGVTVDVAVADDDVVNAAEQTSIDLVHAVVDGSSSDEYDGETVIPVSFNATDNDTPAINFARVGSGDVTEGTDTQVDFTVTLAKEPAEDVTIEFLLTNGDDTGNRVSAAPSDEVFNSANWSNPRIVSLTITDDELDAPVTSELIRLEAAAILPTRWAAAPNEAVELTLLDDDDAGVLLSWDPAGANTVAEGESIDYKVTLTSRPDGTDVDVTGQYIDTLVQWSALGSPNAGTPVQLSYSDGTALLERTVTLTVERDGEVNGNRPLAIVHSVTPPAFDDFSVTGGGGTGDTLDLSITEVDSDEILVFSDQAMTSPITTVDVTEGSLVSVWVKLDRKPGQDPDGGETAPVTVTVDVSQDDRLEAQVGTDGGFDGSSVSVIFKDAAGGNPNHVLWEDAVEIQFQASSSGVGTTDVTVDISGGGYNTNSFVVRIVDDGATIIPSGARK